MKISSYFSDTYTSQNNNAIYLGCDGTYQALLTKINCTSDGRDCSELKHWEKNFGEQMKEFQECVGSQNNELAPAQCRSDSVGFTPNKPCSGKQFWHYEEVRTDDFCKNEVNGRVTYFFKSDLEKCQVFDCFNAWSNWTIFPTPEKDCKNSIGFVKKLRSCRQSNDCVIVEAQYTKCDGKTDKRWEDEPRNCY